MADTSARARRGRWLLVATLALAPFALAATARAVPVAIDDPEIVAGMDALGAGDGERARTILERVAPRLTAECSALRESLDGDDARLVSACHGAASAWIHLGLARGLGSDGALAHQAFTRGLALEPAALPRAALTPPKLRKLFEAARQAALGREQAADPGGIAGIEHHPPLVATRGQPLPLDVRVHGAWTKGGSIDVVYVVAGFDQPPVRARLRPDGALASTEIPAGVLLASRVLQYRFDAVESEGRVHRSRWYPVHVVESFADVERGIRDRLADEIDGPALASIDQLRVASELASATALPDGVSPVARRPESPDRSVAGEVAAAIFR